MLWQVHGRESPESLRDVRGFSVKWYTKEGGWGSLVLSWLPGTLVSLRLRHLCVPGNWDLVGELCDSAFVLHAC